MNASSSSPPVALSPSEIAPPSKRNRTFWRPLLSCGGALVTGALLIHLLPAQATTSPADLPLIPVIEAPMTVPASQIIEAKLALAGTTSGGRTMRGQWKLTTDATGRAPLGGEVARWVVEPGARVQAGDKVVEISTGAATRPAPIAESRQSRAEQEQVAAANGQNALSQNLILAQSQLAEAQTRVERAKEKVAQTRVLVRRLQAGEKVPVDDGTGTSRSRKHNMSEAPHQSRDQKRANVASDEAASRASSAKAELDDAQKVLAKAQKRSNATATTLTTAEGDFKSEKVTADVLQSARSDADDAASALKAAQTRVDVARRTYSTRQQAAKASETKAQITPTSKPEPTQVEADDKRYLTADQAATLVDAALRESKAATRQAERIHARVDDYQRQVSQSSHQVETASKDLQNAQETVMQSVPHAVFTASRAPVSGTVTWISRLAREVGAGESVFGISRGKSGVLRFEDTSGVWKSLKVGQVLNAAPAPDELPAVAGTPVTTLKASPAMPPSGSPAMPSSGSSAAVPIVPVAVVPTVPVATFSIRITKISPPAKDGEAAQIEAVRSDGSASSEGAATGVQAELPAALLPVAAPSSETSTRPQSVVVPLSVILPRDGASFVAVVEAGSKSTLPSVLRWRAVQIEKETPFDVEIKFGLRQGERVVDQPILLLSRLKPEEKSTLPIVVEAVG